jgi:membrane-bound lytic murein transglycosylase D
MKYLAIVESALKPRARSRVGATGLWQFMYQTGKQFDLDVSSYVDERSDPYRATEAACKYLSSLYKIFGDWDLALAAYNSGPGNVNKAIRRSGGKRDFWEIYYRLPKETRGYVPAFIAANYAFAYYKEHNIIPTTIDLNIATDTIAINDFLHFEQISQVINISVEELRDLNPQYKKDVIPAKTRTYPLRLPVDYVDDFIDLKDSIFAYKDSVYFSPERKVVEPPKYQKGGTTANYSPPPTKDMIKIMYNVKSGDNVGFISSWYGVGVSDVSYWNNLYKNRIRAGQKLVIYKHKNVASKYVGINKMSFDAKQKMIGKPVSKTSTIKSEPSSNSSGNYVYYTVRQGDNFWSIAKKYPGVSNDEIMKLNGITDPTSLKAGQKLKIKKK